MDPIKTFADVTEREHDFTNQQSLKMVTANRFKKDKVLKGSVLDLGRNCMYRWVTSYAGRSKNGASPFIQGSVSGISFPYPPFIIKAIG